MRFKGPGHDIGQQTRRSFWLEAALLVLALTTWGGCVTQPTPGRFSPRRGDEMVVAGRFVHTGTPIVLWLDPGGPLLKSFPARLAR